MSYVSLIDGHIDFDDSEARLADLKKDIDELVDSFYEYGELHQSKEVDGEEVMLEDALAELLHEYKDIVNVSSIETETCFESCGYDTGVISLAFVNPITGLEHYLFQWERS